jgi:integrative and conjugative element protein (TIGR02256 family)
MMPNYDMVNESISVHIPSLGRCSADEELILKRDILNKKLNKTVCGNAVGVENNDLLLVVDSSLEAHETEEDCIKEKSIPHVVNIPWYERDLELFELEKQAMANFFPDFKLDKLDDGRMCWIGNIAPCGQDDIIWNLMAVYNDDHPDNSSGDSIKIYVIYPDLNDMKESLAPAILPHVLRDNDDKLFLSLSGKNSLLIQNRVPSAATFLKEASKWTFAVTHWLHGDIEDNDMYYKNIDTICDNYKKESGSKSLYTNISSSTIPTRVIFSNRAFTAILAETMENISTETGGVFLGVRREDIWYVVESIDPGPKSIFQVAYFEYDGDYVRHLANKTNHLYGDRLDVLGLWHRHPGSMDTFSSTDHGTMKKYAEQNNGVTISALVNLDPNFRLTMYAITLAGVLSCVKIQYEIDDCKIPKEVSKVLIYKDLESEINALSTGEKPINITRNIDFRSIFLDYLKKAENLKIARGAIIENTENDHQTLIDNYIVYECLYSEERNIPFSCDSKEGRRIEFAIGEKGFEIVLSFYIFNFSQRGILQNYPLLKFLSPHSKMAKISGCHPCFVYDGRLYLYEGNLLKTVLEESTK